MNANPKIGWLCVCDLLSKVSLTYLGKPYERFIACVTINDKRVIKSSSSLKMARINKEQLLKMKAAA
jgi:hypothetical protein